MTVGIDTNTVLMLHFEAASASAVFTDYSNSSHTVTAVGSAAHDATTFHFDTASVDLQPSAAGNFVQVTNNSDFEFGSGDYTIEAWVHFTNTDQGVLFTHQTDGSNFMECRIGTGTCRLLVSDGGTQHTNVTDTSALTTTGSFVHIAMEKQGTTGRIFYDGIVVASGLATGTQSARTGDIQIGEGFIGFLSGFVDEYRISNIARYGSAFTTETESWFSSTPVSQSISPSSGRFQGGTSITISGHSFQTGPTATFGANAASSIVFINQFSFTADTPAAAIPGSTVDVNVTNSDGGTSTLSKAFSYDSFTDNAIIVITATNTGTATTNKVYPTAMYWNASSTGSGEQLLVADSDGNPVWSVSSDGTRSNYKLVHYFPTSMNGLEICQLTSGTLYIYQR